MFDQIEAEGHELTYKKPFFLEDVHLFYGSVAFVFETVKCVHCVEKEYVDFVFGGNIYIDLDGEFFGRS